MLMHLCEMEHYLLWLWVFFLLDFSGYLRWGSLLYGHCYFAFLDISDYICIKQSNWGSIWSYGWDNVKYLLSVAVNLWEHLPKKRICLKSSFQHIRHSAYFYVNRIDIINYTKMLHTVSLLISVLLWIQYLSNTITVKLYVQKKNIV